MRASTTTTLTPASKKAKSALRGGPEDGVFTPKKFVKIVMEYLILFATFARPQKVIEVPDEATKIEIG